jgi:opacity protein-like surface antigen
MIKTSMLAAVGGLAFATPALADTNDYYGPPPPMYQPEPAPYEPSMYDYSWNEPWMQTGIGVGVMLGGGISGFTDDGMRDVVTSDIGGLWDLRLTIGSHIPIGIDLSYVGTAYQLETLSGIDNGTLIGTAFEATVKWNILPHYLLNPYIFAGVGWQRYDVTDANFSTAASGMRDDDDVVEFPFGAGFQYRDFSGLVVDVRGTFRATDDSSLLRDPDGDFADLHTWEVSAGIGYEF